MDRDMYYLMDLERTIRFGKITYWKPNRRGYTFELQEAGIYTAAQAKEITADDIEDQTIPLTFRAVQRLLEN